MFRKFPVGLGNDRNDFQVETRGSERADGTELGFQHYVVLNPGDEQGMVPRGQGPPGLHCHIGTRLEWWKRLILFHKVPLTPSGPVSKSIPHPQFSHIYEESSFTDSLDPTTAYTCCSKCFLCRWEVMTVQREN